MVVEDSQTQLGHLWVAMGAWLKFHCSRVSLCKRKEDCSKRLKSFYLKWISAGTFLYVWSLAQFYSVGFCDVESVLFFRTLNRGLDQLFLTVSWDLGA